MRKNLTYLLTSGDISAARRFVLDEFNGASDRAAAIVAASLLEEQLATLLIAFFLEKPDSENKDRLFDGPNAPLGSFSPKIDLAYRLGLISRRERDLLHFVRETRNTFAHTWSKQSFHDQSIADRCRHHELPVDVVPPNFDSLRVEKASGDAPRALFREVIAFLVDALVARTFGAQRGYRTRPEEFADYSAMLSIRRRELLRSFDELTAAMPSNESMLDLAKLAITLIDGGIDAARRSLEEWKRDHPASCA